MLDANPLKVYVFPILRNPPKYQYRRIFAFLDPDCSRSRGFFMAGLRLMRFNGLDCMRVDLVNIPIFPIAGSMVL